MAAEQQRPPVAPRIIYHAFRPQIAIYSSPDVDELAKSNGLQNLAQLLKPWESSVERVTLRTSTFVSHVVPVLPLLIDDARDIVHTELDALFLDSLSESITKRVPTWLEQMDTIDVHDNSDEDMWKEGTIDELTPWYGYYREALVNLRPRTEYETFGHPVACMLAVSTSNPEPMNAFAELYEATSPERLFADRPWVDPNVLRYYVLVHDATIGPVEDWIPLLDDVRRAYGLHTNLLILNDEAVDKPDSAYIDASQRPQAKPADFGNYWTDLPTSPTLPRFDSGPTTPDITTASISQRQAEAGMTSKTDAIGAKLGPEDVKRIKLFLREFVVQNLAPWMERTTAQLNEQLAANRKGIAGRLFSAGRRYFGSRPASPAGGTTPNASAFDPIKGYYRHTSQEAQTRRLADFALMIADYRLAAVNYEIARKDFLNDKAWRYYASATRITGLINLLLRKAPHASTSDIDHYLEQASAVPAAGTAQLDGLRSIALYYELYQEQEDWLAAARGLSKFASDIDELPSALMIEQAAMAVLRLQHPARRRFALLMTIAAHRYQKTGPKSLADRCGRQALTLFATLEGKDWTDFRNHLERMLGRQAFNDGKPAEALIHFLRVLVDDTSSEHSAPIESQDFLDDLELAWARLGVEADAVSEKFHLKPPEPIFVVNRTAILGNSLYPAAALADTEAWASLEQAYLQTGYPYTPEGSTTAIKAPFSLLDDAVLNVVTLGDSFEVVLWAYNNLGLPVALTDVTLAFASEKGEDGLVAETLSRVNLEPQSTTKIIVSVQSGLEGKFWLKTAHFRYNGMMKCTESLHRKGPRLNVTKAQQIQPTYAEDLSMTILVKPQQPLLQVTCAEMVTEILAGEVVQLKLQLKNSGAHSLSNLRVMCDQPAMCFNGDRASPIAKEALVTTEIDNALRRATPVTVTLPANVMQPDGRTELNVRLYGATEGIHNIRWLFTFSHPGDLEGTQYSACHEHQLRVSASLTFEAASSPYSSVGPSLCLRARNDGVPGPVEITGVTMLASACALQAGTVSDACLGQGVYMQLPFKLVPPSQTPQEALQPSLDQLDAILQGRDPQERLLARLELTISRIGHQNDTFGQAECLVNKSRLRLEALSVQFPPLDTSLLDKCFPLFLPSTVDLAVSWKLPDCGRQGWHYLADLDVIPTTNVAGELLDKASSTTGGGRYEESQLDRTKLIDLVQNCELARAACPLTVVQKEGILNAHNSQSSCSIVLTNTGLEEVSVTLELVLDGMNLGYRRCPSVQWCGRLVQRCTLGVGQTTERIVHYVKPVDLADQGTWMLQASNGRDNWHIVGSESLTGIQTT